jgi:hypothetical protein
MTIFTAKLSTAIPTHCTFHRWYILLLFSAACQYIRNNRKASLRLLYNDRTLWCACLSSNFKLIIILNVMTFLYSRPWFLFYNTNLLAFRRTLAPLKKLSSLYSIHLSQCNGSGSHFITFLLFSLWKMWWTPDQNPQGSENQFQTRKQKRGTLAI